ncbi:transcriptional regulator [Dulcicalothrix desertica PCC 7102]|uniref:Transcriptional regulator n=1 Tax=Dulcicalothrix desertica PCC 7102 TaxID=232991 RepID=A0A433VJ24_9CYAN|nr:transcriptional regulator [Dulcicalothrix desertica]RUT06079.1 transcriptional regulator [Dulcicalothrix desertica PCC 7102]TWH54258.1 HTH-type transcriptional regulator/antitoxin HigA [Dulcicalothrix desertica PCC 7102]
MTLTFNHEVYANLLTSALPQAIKTTSEYERALSIIEDLMYKKSLTPEEDQIYDLFIVLIEKFEAENYPLQNLSTPHSRLLHLMEANNLKQTDLLDVFGSSGIASEVINGKREISKTHAKKLGERFNIPASVFLA